MSDADLLSLMGTDGHEPDCLWIDACLHRGPLPDNHEVRPEHA